MKTKTITWVAFALLVLLQLWVPASVITHKENVLSTGTPYKFRTAPRDPNDYLRGKYVFLNFNETSFQVTNEEPFYGGQEIYVSIGKDAEGFAKIIAVSPTAKNAGKDYIKTMVDYVSNDSLKTIYVNWPFNRFYMEETKAPLAEKAYNQATIDSNMVSYALVKVKNGDAVLENIYINDKPIDVFIKK